MPSLWMTSSPPLGWVTDRPGAGPHRCLTERTEEERHLRRRLPPSSPTGQYPAPDGVEANPRRRLASTDQPDRALKVGPRPTERRNPSIGSNKPVPIDLTAQAAIATIGRFERWATIEP